VPSSRRKGVGIAAAALVVAVILALGIGSQRRAGPHAAGSGCLARGHRLDVQLTASQAAIAATIAGVAQQRELPPRAVTIAFAAALQESDLQNLRHGDRDSVGVFQQRPSQGWGAPGRLTDPVYASTRFFAALAAVPGYQRLPVYQAAQEVQRSADGSAYGDYAPMAASMAGPFTGRAPRAVWCWYGAAVSGAPRLRAAATQLLRVFGPLGMPHRRGRDLAVQARGVPDGWAVAAWLVTHAPAYRLRTVSYLGYRWSAAHGAAGWETRPGGHHASQPGGHDPGQPRGSDPPAGGRPSVAFG
jgi:hypothetical protein